MKAQSDELKNEITRKLEKLAGVSHHLIGTKAIKSVLAGNEKKDSVLNEKMLRENDSLKAWLQKIGTNPSQILMKPNIKRVPPEDLKKLVQGPFLVFKFNAANSSTKKDKVTSFKTNSSGTNKL
jgi:hypothetical protein